MSHTPTPQLPATDHAAATVPERSPDDDKRAGDATDSTATCDGSAGGGDVVKGASAVGDGAAEKPRAGSKAELADEEPTVRAEPGETEAGETEAGVAKASEAKASATKASDADGKDTAVPPGPSASVTDEAEASAQEEADVAAAKGTDTGITQQQTSGTTATTEATEATEATGTTNATNSGASQAPPSGDTDGTTHERTAEPPTPRGWRARRPGLARGLAWTATGLALLLVLFALIVPNDITKFEPARFVRIPAEAILGAGLLLLLPPRTRKLMSVVMGAGLGLLILLKLLDMGFYWTLDRPFDLVLDWILLDDAQSFMKDLAGEGGALAATIGLIVLMAALVVLLVLSVLRLTRLMVHNRHTTGRTLLVLGTAWITCSTLTLEFSGVPVASHSAATLVENRVEAVRSGLRDGKAFQKQADDDAFADVPPDQLLTGLRGKDVLITFIESYGRSAIDDPQMGEPLGETLEQKTKELTDAGYASQSGWLRSPITGAGSWLGHSTFLSGLWIKNEQRYRNLVSGDRLTLTEAFRRTGAWRTVGIVPGTQMAWPEGKYFGLDHIYDSDELGYKGPKFSWSTMPDQYTLKAFEELEHGKADRKPMMAEIILTSSHNPWAPIPRTIPEDQVGDGSVYHSLQKKEGKDPTEVWKDPANVRDEYRKSIEYSVTSIVDYVAKYGSKDTVLVFLGDHQPNKTITGENPNYDVPISIVAQDPEVLDKISDWGWTDGLKPAENAPEWRMDKFRDRFMTAFGPQGAGAP